MGTIRTVIALLVALLMVVKVALEPAHHWPLLLVAGCLVLAVVLRRTRYRG